MSALDVLKGPDREQSHPADQPRWIEPMLATLTEDYFSDNGWIFERKLDGERVLAFRSDDARAPALAQPPGPHRHLPRGHRRPRR